MNEQTWFDVAKEYGYMSEHQDENGVWIRASKDEVIKSLADEVRKLNKYIDLLKKEL